MKRWSLLAVLLWSSISAAAEVTMTEVMAADVSTRHWSWALDSEFYMNTRTSYHLASAKYSLNSVSSLKFVPTFEINAVPADKAAENLQDEIANGKTFNGARLTDPFVAFASSAGTLWGSDPFSTEVRYYLPVSELSRELQTAGIVRVDYIIPWSVGRWTFSYYLNPRLFLESGATERETTLSFREHALVSYNISSTWSSYIMAGHRLLLKARNFLKNEEGTYVFEAGVTKALSKKFSVTLYMDNFFHEGEEDVNLFMPEKNEVTLYTSINF